MPGKGKAISATRARANPDLGFTAGELDAELRAILDSGGPERIQKADLTREAAEEYWGLARSQTEERLAKLVEEGKFTKHLVMIGKTHRTVWRRVKAGAKKPKA